MRTGLLKIGGCMCFRCKIATKKPKVYVQEIGNLPHYLWIVLKRQWFLQLKDNFEFKI